MAALAVEDMLPFADWPTAGRSALAFLHRTVGLDVWMLTQVVDDQQVVLHAHPAGDVPPGTAVAWDRSFCRKMVSGEAPRVATVAAAVPAYRDVLDGQPMRVAAYFGVPLLTRDGAVFGTLCGTSARAQPLSLTRHLPLVEFTARMLSSLLPADAAQAVQPISSADGPPAR